MEKSFFAQYCEERLGKTVLENEHGFLSFYETELNGKKIFYIEDVFIKPESRAHSEADVLYIDAHSIAKSRGYKEIFGSVFINAKGAEKSMLMLLNRKWVFSHLNGNMIFLKKDI